MFAWCEMLLLVRDGFCLLCSEKKLAMDAFKAILLSGLASLC